MKPIHQTKFGVEEGNCFQACIASILEIPIEDVPGRQGTTEDEDRAIRDWLREQYGMGFACTSVARDWDWVPPGYSILVGASPRGYWHHTVVCLDGEMVHDPHPDGTFVTSRAEWYVFTVLDPAKRQEVPDA